MIFENEYYRLELIPRYVAKPLPNIKKQCPHCNGTGKNIGDDVDLYFIFSCDWCGGTGERWEKQLPPEKPPIIEMAFIEHMRKAVQEFKNENPDHPSP